MTLAHAPTPEAAPWWRDRDPRWRLAAWLTAVVVVAVLRNPYVTLVTAGATYVGSVAANLPLAWLQPRWAILLLTALPFAVLLLLTQGFGGLALAVGLLAKLFALGTLGMLLLASGPIAPTLAALQSWGVPKVLIGVGMLLHRYIEVLSAELQRLRLALRLRAYHNQPGWQGWRTAGQVAGTLIVRGSDRADRVAAALRCRGFRGTIPLTQHFRSEPADLRLAGITAAVGAGLLLADWWLG